MLCEKRGDASKWFSETVAYFKVGWKRSPLVVNQYYFVIPEGWNGFTSCNVVIIKMTDGYWSCFAPSTMSNCGERAKSKAIAAARLIRAELRMRENVEQAKAVMA